MYINKKSPIPVYFQLKNIIKKKIDDGEYPEGSLIPSEREFSDSLGISRMTVRQALNQLVGEGILYREKGRGTFVSYKKLEQRNIMSFSDTVRRKGLSPSTRILDFKKTSEAFDIKAILELDNDEILYNVRRLRLANDVPVAVEEVFIPERYCSGLERFDLTQSLYKLIKDEYSHTISYIDNSIDAGKPTGEEKELLKISGATPVLRISGTSYSENGIRLFFERDVYRSDSYTYNVRIYMNRE